jgi:hypothetical protein
LTAFTIVDIPAWNTGTEETGKERTMGKRAQVCNNLRPCHSKFSGGVSHLDGRATTDCVMAIDEGKIIVNVSIHTMPRVEREILRVTKREEDDVSG